MPDREKVLAVIQCAMPMEASPWREILEAPGGEDSPIELRFGHPSGFEQSFRLGRIDKLPVLLAVSGIGLANAASATARALALVDAPDRHRRGNHRRTGPRDRGRGHRRRRDDDLRRGRCHGLRIRARPGARNAGRLRRLRPRSRVEALGGVLEHPVRAGRVVSSDSFITAPLAEPMRERFPDAIGADMRPARWRIAWSAGVDWVSLRAVSDLCGPVRPGLPHGFRGGGPSFRGRRPRLPPLEGRPHDAGPHGVHGEHLPLHDGAPVAG